MNKPFQRAACLIRALQIALVLAALLIIVAFIVGQTSCTTPTPIITPESTETPTKAPSETPTGTPTETVTETPNTTPTRVPEVQPTNATPVPAAGTTLLLRVVAEPCLYERDAGGTITHCYDTDELVPVVWPPFMVDSRGIEIEGGWCWLSKDQSYYVACGPDYLSSRYPDTGSLTRP